MARPSHRRARRVVGVCYGLTAAAVLPGCADSQPVGPGTSTPQASASHGGTEGALPSAHVHAVAVNPADDRVYLATRDGLFRYDPDGPTRVGPMIDLMGFSVAGPDRFYASGHPGPGTDLPEPVGLIESLDGGRVCPEFG